MRLLGLPGLVSGQFSILKTALLGPLAQKYLLFHNFFTCIQTRFLVLSAL